MRRPILVLGGPDGLTELTRSRLAAPQARGESGDAAGTPSAGKGPEVLGIEGDLPAAARSEPGPGTAVYLAASRAARPGSGRFWGPDLDDAARALDLCELAGVEHLILVSSAEAGEPSHRHPNPATEGQSIPVRTGIALPKQWQRLEALAESWQRGSASEEPAGGHVRSRRRLTVLRTAPVLDPRGRDFWSRLFRRPAAFPAPGYDPPLQLLHPDDLAEAISRISALPASEGEPELLHLAPRASLSLRRALRIAGVRRLAVPRLLQAPARAILSRFGLAAPIAQIDYLRYPFSLASARCASRLGFEPRRSSGRCVASAGRRAGRAGKEAAKTSLPGLPGPPDPWADEDPYGLDVPYIRRLSATLFRFLHEIWWRVDSRGLEHVPREGGAVLTGTHRGHQPWDGVMAMYLIAREHRRLARFLTHPTLLKFPFLTPFMTRLGGVPARQEAADWVLERREILGIFPEGIRGAFRSYGPDVYRLCSFGRDDYVRLALRHRVPIVPFVTVGSAEILPILAKLHPRWWRRWSEWPCLPLTPTLGTFPLPSKWHTRFLEPVPTAHLPEGAEHDAATVTELSGLVRRRMQHALDDLVQRRRRIFWGSLEPGEAAPPEARPMLDPDPAGAAGETRK